MKTKATTWLAQIAVVLALVLAGAASASSGLLSANSCRDKNTLEGGFHQGSASVSAETGRGYADFCHEEAADSVVAPQKLTPAQQLEANKAQGAAFEQQVMQDLQQTQQNIVQQVTVRTQSGVKTRLDFIGNEQGTGAVVISEAKSSATAPLTPNQTVAFPEIAQSGATVVGKGKPGFPGGTKIPPTTVIIIRPE